MSLEKTATDALLAYLGGIGNGLTLCASDGLTAGQVFPALVVTVAGQGEVADGSGVYRVACRVEVMTELDTANARTQHAANVAAVRDKLEDQSTLLTAMSSGARCFGVTRFSWLTEMKERLAVGGVSFDAIMAT